MSEDWEPIVESSADGESGTFTVRQPNIDSIPFGDDIVYNWDIEFDEDVALGPVGKSRCWIQRP